MTESRDSLRRKRAAYLRTFYGDLNEPHPEAARVLSDLKKFCGVTKPGIVVSPKTGIVDSHATTYRAGQRDVYMRIAGFLGIDEKTLFQENGNEQDISKTAER